MPAILQLDLQQVLSQVLAFLLLLWFLRRFAWRPLLGILDARREHIEEELRQAARTKAELARVQEEYAQRLSKIEEEARLKIQQAILEGKRISAEIQEQARAQASAILTKSKEAVELELAKAKQVLKEQVASMAIDATEQMLRRKLDREADRKLVDAVLDELEKEASRA